MTSSKHSNEPNPGELYHRMRREILNAAEKRRAGQVNPENLWTAIFNDGFYETLAENPHLSFEFLLVTDRGPTWHYQHYLNRAKDYDDLLALVALSALVNDALH